MSRAFTDSQSKLTYSVCLDCAKQFLVQDFKKMPKRAYNKKPGSKPKPLSKSARRKLAKPLVPSYTIHDDIYCNKETLEKLKLAMDSFNKHFPASPTPLPRTATGRIRLGAVTPMPELKTAVEIATEKSDIAHALDERVEDEQIQKWLLDQAVKINDFWKERLVAAARGEFQEPTDMEVSELLDLRELLCHVRLTDVALPPRRAAETTAEYKFNISVAEHILRGLKTGRYKIDPECEAKDSEGKRILGKCVKCGEPVVRNDENSPLGFDWKHSVDAKGSGRGAYKCDMNDFASAYAELEHPLYLIYPATSAWAGRHVPILGECKHCKGLVYKNPSGIVYHAEHRKSTCPGTGNGVTSESYIVPFKDIVF